MTDLNAGTKLCTNCDQEIKLANFLPHEAFCTRNIIKCDKCKKPVEKKNKNAHDEEFHSKVKCECGQDIDKSKLDAHKSNDCSKRKLKCSYCDLSHESSKLAEHMNHCGARTEECEKCQRRVQLKDKIRHDDSNCEYPEPIIRRAKIEETLTKPKNRLSERVWDLPFETNDLDYSHLGATSVDPYQDDDYGNDLIPCEFCNQSYPSETLFQHQVNCTANTSSSTLGFNLDQIGDGKHQDLRNSMIRNTRPPLAPKIENKTSNSRSNLTTFRDSNKRFEMPTSSNRFENDIFKRSVTRKTERKSNIEADDNETIMIPCEICKKSFDIDAYKFHFLDCQGFNHEPRSNLISKNPSISNRTEPKKYSSPSFFVENETKPARNEISSNLLPNRSRSKNSTSRFSTEATSNGALPPRQHRNADRSNENKPNVTSVTKPRSTSKSKSKSSFDKKSFS